MQGFGNVPSFRHVVMGLKLRKNMKRDVDLTYFKSLVGSLRHLTCTRPIYYMELG
jgi:hypothetical protein